MTPTFETISKDKTLHIFSFTKDYFEFNWHFHPEYEMTLILEGEGKRFLGNRAEDFFPHDLVLVGSGIPHTWKSEDLQDQKASALVIQFSESVIKPIIELPEFSGVKKCLESSIFGLQIEMDDHILEKMLQLEKKVPAMQIITLYELFFLISRQKNRRILTEPYEVDYSKKNHRISFVLNYLEHHYQYPCKIEEIAGLVHLTKSGFSKFFKNQTGLCYSDYVNDLRVKKSIKLLTETDQSIKEIYLNVGFENQAYFNRVFKKVTSVSPKRYRNLRWL